MARKRIKITVKSYLKKVPSKKRRVRVPGYTYYQYAKKQDKKRSAKRHTVNKVTRVKPVKQVKKPSQIRKPKFKPFAKAKKSPVSYKVRKANKRTRKSVSRSKPFTVSDKRAKKATISGKNPLIIVSHIEQNKTVGAVTYLFDSTITIKNLPRSNQKLILWVRQWGGLPEMPRHIEANKTPTGYKEPRAVMVIFKIKDNEGGTFYNSDISAPSMVVDVDNVINFVTESIADYNNTMAGKLEQYDTPVKMFLIVEITIRFLY